MGVGRRKVLCMYVFFKILKLFCGLGEKNPIPVNCLPLLPCLCRLGNILKGCLQSVFYNQVLYPCSDLGFGLYAGAF